MNPSDNDIAAILDKAADYLDEYGWCQGDLYEDEAVTPRACAVGALYITVSGAPVEALCVRDPEAYRRAEAAAALVIDTLGLGYLLARDESIQPVDELVWWNDGTDRTAQEVVDTFRSIAADYRRERAS